MEAFITRKWGRDVQVVRVKGGNPLSELFGGVYRSVFGGDISQVQPLAADLQLSELVKSVVK